MPDFYLEPGQLGPQTPDFGIQLVELPFMLGLLGFLAFALILEQLREVLQGLLLQRCNRFSWIPLSDYENIRF